MGYAINFLQKIRGMTLLIFILNLSSINAFAATKDLPQITILAASSTADPITELVQIYSRQNNIIVTASFDGTSELARKVEQGDQADILISAHPLWMSLLKQRGLIDVYSLTNLVKNKLVLVASSKSNISESVQKDKTFAEQINYLIGRKIMVMGDFDNSALGLYTKQAILNTDANERTKLWAGLHKKVIPSITAKHTLYLIAHGETAGIIYYSDAFNNKEVKILSVIEDSLHEPIIYQAAVVAGENMTIARDFLKFLQSDLAKQVFKKYGFIVD